MNSSKYFPIVFNAADFEWVIIDTHVSDTDDYKTRTYPTGTYLIKIHDGYNTMGVKSIQS